MQFLLLFLENIHVDGCTVHIVFANVNIFDKNKSLSPLSYGGLAKITSHYFISLYFNVFSYLSISISLIQLTNTCKTKM